VIATVTILIAGVGSVKSEDNLTDEFMLALALAQVFNMAAVLLPPSLLAITSFHHRIVRLKDLQV